MTRTIICLLVSLSVALSLQAAESEPSLNSGETRMTEQQSTVVKKSAGPDRDAPEQGRVSDLEAKKEPENKQKTVSQQSSINEPTENLKNRKLGAALRQFRPSEEISADNAVPFPVDI